MAVKKAKFIYDAERLRRGLILNEKGSAVVSWLGRFVRNLSIQTSLAHWL